MLAWPCALALLAAATWVNDPRVAAAAERAGAGVRAVQPGDGVLDAHTAEFRAATELAAATIQWCREQRAAMRKAFLESMTGTPTFRGSSGWTEHSNDKAVWDLTDRILEDREAAVKRIADRWAETLPEIRRWGQQRYAHELSTFREQLDEAVLSSLHDAWAGRLDLTGLGPTNTHHREVNAYATETQLAIEPIADRLRRLRNASVGPEQARTIAELESQLDALIASGPHKAKLDAMWTSVESLRAEVAARAFDWARAADETFVTGDADVLARERAATQARTDGLLDWSLTRLKPPPHEWEWMMNEGPAPNMTEPVLGYRGGDLYRRDPVALWARPALAPLSLATMQPPPSTMTNQTPLEGTWLVSYLDAQMGEVKGEAIIKRGDQSGTVKYTLPPERPGDFDRTFPHTITKIERTGSIVKLTVEGTPPSGPRVLPPDLKGIKQLPVPWGGADAPPPSGQVSAKDYARAITVQTVERPEVDVVHLEMTLSPFGDMTGQWSYRCDPITERDLRGVGRVGTFELVEGVALSGTQRGPERWARKRPTIEGALVTVDQYRLEPYGPAWPWPFADGRPVRPGDAARKIVVWGKDLPKRGEPAVFERLTPGITNYWLDMAVGEERNDALRSDMLSSAWKRVQEVAASRGERIDRAKYEVVLLSTAFDKTVTPGRHAFTLNGAPATWVLGFGDLQGDLRFARPMSEDIVPATPGAVPIAGEVEVLTEALLREYVVIECVVQTTVETVPSIAVQVQRAGKPVMVGGADEVTLTRYTVEDQRSDRDRREGKPLPSIYRSPLIRLVDADRPPAARGRVGSLDLACKPKDVLKAVPLAASTLDIRKPAQVTVVNGPSDLGMMWKDALRTAAACRGLEPNYDWNSISQEEADEVANYCFADITPLKGLQVLVNLFNPISLDKLEPLKRTLAVTIGDHAAMLLLRKQVVPMLAKQNENLAKINTDDLTLAWGMSIEDGCASGANPLGKLEVTKPPSAGLKYGISKIAFSLACSDSFRAEVFPGDEAGARRYFTQATREVLDQYRTSAKAALDRAQNAGDCDVTELLEITGTGFDAVAAKVIPRLMRLEEDPGPPQSLTWVPDRVARAYVSGLGRLADAVKAQQDYAKLDTQFALLIAGGIASMPAIISEGFIAAVISFALNAGLFGVDAGMAIYDQIKNDEEYEFALGARGIVSDDRLSDAILGKTEWWQTMALIVGQGLLTGVDGLGTVLRYDLEAARKAAPAIIEKMRKAGTLTEALQGLSPTEQKQLLAAISDAEQAAVMKGLDKLTPEQKRLFDLGSELSVEVSPKGPRLAPSEPEPVRPAPATPSDTPAPPVRPTTPESSGGITDAVAPPRPTTPDPVPGPRPTTPDPTASPGPRPVPTDPAPGPRPATPDPSPGPRPSTTEPAPPRPTTPDSTPPPRPTPTDPGPTPRPSTPDPSPSPRPGPTGTEPAPRPGPTGAQPAPPPRPTTPDSAPRPSTPDPTPSPRPGPTGTEPAPRPGPTGAQPAPPPRPTTPDSAPHPGPTGTEPNPRPRPGPTGTEPNPGPRPRPAPVEPPPPPRAPDPPTPRDAGLSGDDLPSTWRDPEPTEPVVYTRREPTFDPSTPRPTGENPRTPREPTFDPPSSRPTPDGPGPTPREPSFDPSTPRPTGDGPGPTPREPSFDPSTPRPTGEQPNPPRPVAQPPNNTPPPPPPPPPPPALPIALPPPPPPGRQPVPLFTRATMPANARVISGAPPPGGAFLPDAVYTKLPPRRAGDEWKRGFKYMDGKGNVYELKTCLGQGGFNRAYPLGGAGNEGLVIKFRMSDDVADKAQMVKWAKQASDDLEKAGVPQLRVHQAVTDAGQPYMIMDMADPAKGQKVLDFKTVGDEMALDASKRTKWTRKHQEAVVDLSRKLVNEGFVAEDLKLDNIFLQENADGSVIAGVLDHDRIGRIDDAQMRAWTEYYDPREVDALKPRVLRDLQDASKAHAAAVARGAPADEVRLLRADMDNALREYEAVRSNYNMNSLKTHDLASFDWGDAEGWAVRMFEHNHWIKYDPQTGQFVAQYLDPEVVRTRFDLDGYLGPNRPMPSPFRFVPADEFEWRMGPRVPLRRAA